MAAAMKPVIAELLPEKRTAKAPAALSGRVAMRWVHAQPITGSARPSGSNVETRYWRTSRSASEAEEARQS